LLATSVVFDETTDFNRILMDLPARPTNSRPGAMHAAADSKEKFWVCLGKIDVLVTTRRHQSTFVSDFIGAGLGTLSPVYP
jgi:hypothetical protein